MNPEKFAMNRGICKQADRQYFMNSRTGYNDGCQRVIIYLQLNG
jgi:hypothetical protein